MRDRDEWRRPWAEGAARLPAAATEQPADYVSAAPQAGSQPAAQPAPQPFPQPSWSGLDGAFDLTAETVPAPSLPAPATPAPSSAAAGGQAGAEAAPRGPRARGGLLGGLLAGVVGALATVVVLAAVGVVDVAPSAVGGDAPAAQAPTAAPDPAAPRPTLPGQGADASVIPDVAELVLPSVVRINASGSGDLSAANALGSGVIYRSDGYIITNHHVIENARAVEVLLSDGDRFTAEIVGSDELNDLALLRIDRTDLPAIALRPVDEPTRVGETVVAIGSPFGLDATVTSGIVSALNREIRVSNGPDVIPGAIQTDAAINPGNSGGALVDLQGRLVGINTAIQSRSGVNEGVGFAVPVRQAVVSSDQLIEQGFVRYPLLGITGNDINAQVAEAFSLPNRRGAVVATVQSGSGAEAGGLRPGDVIIAVDGLELRSMADLVLEVRRRAPGMTVTLDVVREDGPVVIEVLLGERPR